MKICKNPDNHFKLNKESIEKLCRELTEMYPEIEVNITSSKTTNSYYIKFQLDKYSNSLRISDHNAYALMKNGRCKSLLIGNTTRKKTVAKTINNNVHSLLIKRVLSMKA